MDLWRAQFEFPQTRHLTNDAWPACGVSAQPWANASSNAAMIVSNGSRPHDSRSRSAETPQPSATPVRDSELTGCGGVIKGLSRDCANRPANEWPMEKCFRPASSTRHWLGGSESAAPWGQPLSTVDQRLIKCRDDRLYRLEAAGHAQQVGGNAAAFGPFQFVIVC